MKNKIIAVDFDGTLCENKYPEIGEPRKDVIQKLIKEQQAGARVILWTCRRGAYLLAAIYWALDHGIEFDAVNENLPETVEYFGGDTRKVCADEYWDDRAVLPFESEGTTEGETSLASDILKAIRGRAMLNFETAEKCALYHDLKANFLSVREREDNVLYKIIAGVIEKHGLNASECDKK